MGRLFVTGDTHQSYDIKKLLPSHFIINEELTKDDVMIICGDAGFVWNGSKSDKFWQETMDNMNYTTLCCLGNHENYDLIEQLPIVEMWGGKVYQVSESLFYTLNGEVYTINGKTFLFINGADSHDRGWRTPHESWWEQEAITEQHYREAQESLYKVNHKVDYVISHTGGTIVAAACGFPPTQSDKVLDDILMTVDYTKHYCGHMHVDKWVDNKTRILYDDIIELR